MRGGFALLGVLLIAANLRAALTVVGPLVPTLQADTGLSALAAANLVTIPVLCFAVASPAAPWLAARIGLERALGAAILGTVAGIVLRSFTPQINLWIGTVLLGVSIAVMNVLLPALIRRDYAQKIAQVTSGYQVAQTVVAGLAAMFAVPIAEVAPGGWRLAFGLTAGFGGLAFAVFAPRLVGADVHGGPVAHIGGVATHPAKTPWVTAVGWQVSLFMGLQSSLFYTAITWFPSLEGDFGVDPTVTGIHQGLFQAAGIIGSTLAGVLLSRTAGSQVKVMALTSWWGLAGVIGLLALPEISVVWITMTGTAAGTYIVFAISLMGLRSQNHTQTAKLSGMAQSVGYLVAAVTPMVFGVLRDATGGWEASLWMLATTQVLMIGAGLLAARDRTI